MIDADGWELETLRVADIVADQEKYGARAAGLDHETLKDYRLCYESGISLPPPKVVRVGQKLILVEGFHRHNQMQILGIEEAGFLVAVGDLGDAVDEAARANTTHGLRRSIADKWRQAEMMLREHPDWTDQRIARHCVVDNHFIKKVREAMEAAGEDVAPETRIDSRGGLRKSPPPAAPKAAPSKPGNAGRPENAPAGRCIVDGVERDDTPEIAALRASGKMAADHVPVVDTGASDGDDQDVPTIPPDADPREWAESLDLASQLEGDRRELFIAEAVEWRRLDHLRVALANSWRGPISAMKKRTNNNLPPWHQLMRRFVKANGPDKWVLCPPSEVGGCGGSGWMVNGPSRMSCTKCHGHGYMVEPRR